MVDKAEKKTTGKKFAEMTLVGKVTFVAATIGTILATIISGQQVGSWGIDKIDARTERLVASSVVVDSKVIQLIDENAYTAVKVSLDRRSIQSDMRLLRLELRLIQGDIRDINSTSEGRPLSPDERTDLEELKNDRRDIKQEIKYLEDELNHLA